MASSLLTAVVLVAGALGAGATAPDAALAQPAAPAVAVFPSPGTRYNEPATQITFRGVPATAIGNVTVVGSATGPHTGTIEADSDGDGGSFIPAQPFQPGETVTVTTGLNIIGGSGGKFSFAIVHPSNPIPTVNLQVVKAVPGGIQFFHSRPDLQPPSVIVTNNSAPASEGDIFVAPQYGPSQNGPMILDPRGRLLWFMPFPVHQKMLVTDFRVQALNNQPVLTWWQGTTNHGSGEGVGVIYNTDYQQIAVVHPGNGLQMDLHEFLITPQGQAYVVAVAPVSLPYVRHKPVIDSIVQEIDIKTGLVLFEWHALDHIPLSESSVTQASPGFVFDPYHANSVAPAPDGSVLVSMRDTSTVYDINHNTGQITWRLGGKHSSFKLGPGTSMAFQHDARVQPDGTITIFDDGAGPPRVHAQSRGIRVSLNTKKRTATLIKEYDHSPQLSSYFEGDLQELGDGNVFLGWGQQPYFSEDNAAGHQIFDAHFVEPSGSYRAYRFPWSAQPPTTPAIAVGPGPFGVTNVYASWNGATDVASWRVLAGPSSSSLGPIASVPWNGLETTIPVATQAPFFAVQAIGSSGQLLASTPPAANPPHIALYGRSAFVSNGQAGGIPASCSIGHACKISTTVMAGSTVIARAGPQPMAAGGAGILHFTVMPAGHRMLAHARGNRLAVQITARDSSGVSNTTGVSLISYSAHGAGPHRAVTESPTVRIAGVTDFVSSNGVGGILAACFSTACVVKTTLSVGHTVIASTGPEVIGESQVGYLTFKLTSAGQSMLAHAPGHQLGVSITVAGAGKGATATGQIALVGFR